MTLRGMSQAVKGRAREVWDSMHENRIWKSVIFIFVSLTQTNNLSQTNLSRLIKRCLLCARQTTMPLLASFLETQTNCPSGQLTESR